jgi:hypothetical protein
MVSLHLETLRNPGMNSLPHHERESIDHGISRSICDAVGERLRQSLRLEPLERSTHLAHLMDELRRRDSEASSARPT